MSDFNSVHAVWSALELVEHAVAAMGGGARSPGFNDQHLMLGVAAAAAVVIHGPDLRGSSAGIASSQEVAALLSLVATRHGPLRGLASWVPFDRWPLATFADALRSLQNSRCSREELLTALAVAVRRFESAHPGTSASSEAWRQMRAWIGLPAHN